MHMQFKDITVKSIDLCDLSALMIAPEECDLVRIPYLEGQ